MIKERKNAANLVQDFYWDPDTEFEEEEIEIPDISKDYLVKLGRLSAIEYDSNKEKKGKLVLYRHEFSTKSPPKLYANSKGSMMIIIGGKFKVKGRGIIK